MQAQGRLKWFDENKNFGFITGDDGKEIFVHRRHIPNFKQLNLTEGDELTFETFESKKGIQAKQVKKVAKKELLNTAQSKSFFTKHVRQKTTVVLKMTGGKTAIGRISESKSYDFIFDIGQQDHITIRKIDVKYLFQRKQQEYIAQVVKIDKSIREKKVPISEKVVGRYKVSNEMLHEAVSGSKEVTLTLCDGELLTGAINWFSKYEVLLRVHKSASVCVFRHSVIDCKVGQRSALAAGPRGDRKRPDFSRRPPHFSYSRTR